MKRIFLVSLLSVLSVRSIAQQNAEDGMKRKMDSLKTSYLEDAALRYPLIRQAGISMETIGGGKMRTKLNGNDFFEGRLQLTRVNAHFNVPIAHVKKLVMAFSFGLFYQRANLSEVTSYEARLPVQAMGFDNTTLSASLSITQIDSLFKRPVVYSLRISELLDPFTRQTRLAGSGVIAFTLKKTANTTFSVGALILLDPSSPVPVAPYFSYYHKFSTHKLEFFVDPPVRVALRKELAAKRFLSAFIDLGGSTAFFKVNTPSILPPDHLFSTLEIKSGLLYEQRLTRKMVLGISGGLSTAWSQKSQQRNKFGNAPFMKGSQSPLPYLNVGVSFLPFWKGLNL